MRLLFLDCSSAFGKSEAEPLELRYQAEPGNEGIPVREGGLCLCSPEFYSAGSFQVVNLSIKSLRVLI
jgi:hypothetical protein